MEEGSVRILVVEDEVDISMVFRVALSRRNHELIEATSGEEALEKIRSQRPDLVVLDVMLPGMSGLDVLAQVRADEATKDLAVVCVSARATPADQAQGLDAGADAYITKPFAPAELAELLELVAAESPEQRARRRAQARKTLGQAGT